MTAPHPQRCVTCTNREVNCNDDRFCKVTGEEISYIEEDFTAIYGCASHSSAVSEREMVLFTKKELIHIDTILTLHAMEHLPKECDCPECISIHKKIAELRQQGGRE